MDPSLGPELDQLRQESEETSLDRETRNAGKFAEMEASLPRSIRSQAKLPFLGDLASYLGAYNPLARPASVKEDAVWLLDNTAYRPIPTHSLLHQADAQPWQAEYVVAYFKRNSGRKPSEIVAQIADKIGLGAEGEDRAAGEKRIAERLQPFMQDIQPARSVDVKIPGVGVKRLGPGGRGAMSSTTISGLGELTDGKPLTVKALDSGVAPYGSMNTYVADPEGWMVISGTLFPPTSSISLPHLPQLAHPISLTNRAAHLDIDDSIKITMTPSPIGILRSTFVSDPTPIPGMPALYAHIHSVLSPTYASPLPTPSPNPPL